MDKTNLLFNKKILIKNYLMIFILVFTLFLITSTYISKPIHAQAACQFGNQSYFATVKVIVQTSNGAPLPNDLGLHTWTDPCYNGWDNGIPTSSVYNQNAQNWLEASGSIQGSSLSSPYTTGNVTAQDIINYYNKYGSYPSTLQDFGEYNIGNNAVGIDHANSQGVIAVCPSNTGCSAMGGNISLRVLGGKSHNASSVALEYYQIIDCAFSPVNFHLYGVPSGWTSSGNSNTVNVANSPAVPKYIITLTPPTPPKPVWKCTLTLSAKPSGNLTPKESTTLSGTLTVTKNGKSVSASAENQNIKLNASPPNGFVLTSSNPTTTNSSGGYSFTGSSSSGSYTFYTSVTSNGVTCSHSPTVTVTWGVSPKTSGCTLTLNANPSNPVYPNTTTLSGNLSYNNGSSVPNGEPITISQTPSNSSPSSINTTGGNGGYSTTATLTSINQSAITYTASFNNSGINCTSSPVTVTWGSQGCTSASSPGCELPIQPVCNRQPYNPLKPPTPSAYKELYINGSLVGYGGIYNYRDMGGCNPYYPSLRVSYNLKYISLYNIDFIKLIGHNLQYWLEEGI